MMELRQDEQGLALTDGSLSMRADFTTMLPRLKTSNLQREILLKAVKIKGAEAPLRIVDATAGMGEDSLLLAAAGHEVHLYEYDHIIASLLGDALRRGADIPELAPVVARMTLHEEDSIAALPSYLGNVDVVLLDPMFPERKKSGMIGKKFQLLQQLERPCDDEEALLRAALQAEPKKIVIKRPAKGPYLAGMKPDYSFSGKAIRYDCIINTAARKL